MYEVFNSSNFHNVMSEVYTELGVFGTAVLMHYDDYDSIAHFDHFTAGSYLLAQNSKKDIDTIARKTMMTVREIADKFGTETMSAGTKQLWKDKNYDKNIEVMMYIGPRRSDQRKVNSPLAEDMPYMSIYYEVGGEDDKVLGESGYREQPFYAPRWSVTDGDVYATNCPGMKALGDTKGLQSLEIEKATATQMGNYPPLGGPTSLQSHDIENIPGGVTLYDGAGDRQMGPLYETKNDIRSMEDSVSKHEFRLLRTFHADLFQQLANLEGVQPRNQLELSARNHEKLLMLGPLLKSVEYALLDPVVDRVANQVFRAGIMPPPPEELFGQRLRVKYISPLAVAQRQVGTESIDRYTNYVAGVVQVKPEAGDVFNGDESVREYAMQLGLPSKTTNDDQFVEAVRQARREQEEAERAMMAAESLSSSAKNIAPALDNM